MEQLVNVRDIVASVIFSFLGLALFGLAFFIFDRATPGDLWREIVDKQNTAAAIVIGALVIGIAIIVGLSIHG